MEGLSRETSAVIRGQVVENADGELEAWLTVSVEYANEGWRQCDVIIDTGFTGWLTLPEAIIRDLGLLKSGSRPVTLANGEVEHFDYFFTRVMWHAQPQWALIFQSIDQPLLGMELLRGNWITTGAWDGGAVIVEEAGSGPPA